MFTILNLKGLLMDNNHIKGRILHKLVRAGKIEASHTAVENLCRGFPKDKVGDIKECIKELVREGILIQKFTNYGLQVSVNIGKSEKVKQYINGYLLTED